MFEVEHEELCSELDRLLNDRFRKALLPVPPVSLYPAIITMTAAAGGAEASLFLEELSRAYIRFAETRGWSTQNMSSSPGPSGGFRERTMRFDPPKARVSDGEIEDGVFGHLVWERGVHRVQRVPATESQGRLHTSTVGVIVSPFNGLRQVLIRKSGAARISGHW